MPTTPLPGFLLADALDEFKRFDGPLIYLAAPLGHRNPSVRAGRFESANRYFGYLVRERNLVFSPLSLGSSLDATDFPNSVWYALGLQFLARCDEMRILALDGWEESVGVGLEIRYARQLRIPIYVVNSDTYELETA